MSSITSTLVGLASPWAYVAVGLLALLEASAFVGLVIPGELAMLLGGFIAHQGRASVWMMAVAGVVGAIAGESIGYEVGRTVGPRLRRSRAGRWVGEERWGRADAYVKTRAAAIEADGDIREGAEVAEITGLLDLSAWPSGSRVIVRR